jgi:UDP-glucose 4-epimerase|tara:strand:+ start:2921 stop:3670 length:750 start_codon:yes stop_codon:yes gene_type:complete
MKIALTGSRGFIGSHLMERLEKDGHEVIEWDLRQNPPQCIKDFDPKDCCYVIHLAAYANVRQSLEDPQKYWDNNVENTTRIQKICAYNNIPLMYASSSCIHNWWLSPYGTSKKVNEETAFDFQIALRFTTVYGKGARDTMFISKLLDGSVKHLTTHTRDFIHISDVVEAIVLLMNQNNRTLKKAYDIGTGEGHKVEDLGLLAGFGHLPVTDGELCEALDNTADNSDLKALGWEPKMNVEDYIVKKTVPH